MFRTEDIIAKSKRGVARRESAQSSGEYEDAIRRTKIPLHSESYTTGSAQELTFTYYGLEVVVSYSDVLNADTANILIAQKHLASRIPEGSPAFKAETWKKLDRFYVRLPNASTLDLAESVPKEYSIYFCPANSGADPKGFICSEPKAIFYAGDIGTVAGFAVLAHEIGHLHNEILQPKEGRTNTSFHRDQDVAMTILKERYANAFALKLLRVFIKDPQDRKDVLILLRHYGQGSYDHFLTKVNQVRNLEDERVFYEELRKHMDEEYGDTVFGLGEQDWPDEEGDET